MHVPFRFVAPVFGAFVLAGSASAQNIVIDDFSSGATDISIVSGTGYLESQQNGASGIVGGQRDLLLEVLNNPYNRSAEFEVVPSQGASFLSNGAGLLSQVYLDYDGQDSEGNDGFQTAGSGLNLDLSGQNQLRFDFLFADLGLDVKVDFYTYDGGMSTGRFSVMEDTFVPQIYTIDFSSFTAENGGSGVDFSDVDRIVVHFQPQNAATDFGLKSIQAVPEPTSMAAIGLGLVGLISRRRKKA